MIEFPASGGTITSVDTYIVKLIRYVTAYDYFVLACEIFYVAFLILYTIGEIIEVSMCNLISVNYLSLQNNNFLPFLN